VKHILTQTFGSRTRSSSGCGLVELAFELVPNLVLLGVEVLEPERHHFVPRGAPTTNARLQGDVGWVSDQIYLSGAGLTDQERLLCETLILYALPLSGQAARLLVFVDGIEPSRHAGGLRRGDDSAAIDLNLEEQPK
jgi:hypothetical protein